MLGFTDNLTYTLLLVLTLFAVFAWCVRRGIVGAREVVWIGAALGFFGVSLVFNTALRKNIPLYGGNARMLLGMTALMTLPLALAVGYGVSALARSVAQKTLMSLTMEGLTLRLVRGSLATLNMGAPLDVLVCPVDIGLRMTAGESGALRAFGGPEFAQEVRTLGSLTPGQAAAVGAGKLRAREVVLVAALGPKGRTDESQLKRAIDTALKVARKRKARRVALSAFVVGGVLPSVAAPIVVSAVLRLGKDFDEIVIVVFESRAVPAFKAQFAALSEQAAG